MRYDPQDRDDNLVLLMDSISEIESGDANKFIVAGSHCSQNVPRYALSMPLRGAVFNDAGIGKDNAGVSSLGALSAAGLPAAAVSHDTARIGDARDVYENGILSTVNELAAGIGAAPGMSVAEFVELLLHARDRD
ncbi:hypothetical protein [Rhodococcus indonesiensis]|uniref:hypothetical protein n=1 Tax=Rhodococcus indonesiensis TaxID=3055869 RepID=UPI0039F6529C